MSIAKSLKAVIFDLDGIITDTAEYHYQAWKATATELGIPFTREFNENLKGVSRMDSLMLLLSQAETPVNYSEGELVQLADRKNKLYVELIETITPADLLPGVTEFVADIRAAGLKTAIASASKNAIAVLTRLGVMDQFDVIVDVTKLTNNKPDPEIFLTAAAQLGIEPADCIGVEDAASGVDAIKGAGMFAVAIGNAAHFPHADIVLDSTSQLNFRELAQKFEGK
ncbi:beta-phosphoglucomutase [Paenibacillus glucanolyticus]|uniref:Beta-phosphoglucomutase n=1 Tax=Paenibacillus glucanolyticus TaxID=59843 RepID=A0A163JJI6_9BACL|nr:beta-phosphoglucomutase [Paenibacillus glucanolyticus]KZS46623.1 beta-phosphoglucomutase [Paenibacillus glucanolyticus]